MKIQWPCWLHALKSWELVDQYYQITEKGKWHKAGEWYRPDVHDWQQDIHFERKVSVWRTHLMVARVERVGQLVYRRRALKWCPLFSRKDRFIHVRVIEKAYGDAVLEEGVSMSLPLLRGLTVVESVKCGLQYRYHWNLKV
jgi:hypothetical protein